jgi:cation transport regulator ChaB
MLKKEIIKNNFIRREKFMNKEIRYETVEDLSEVLKKVLPDEAQKMYLETYQDSWDNYESWKGGELGRDGLAHRNAMGTVMRKFELDEDSGTWHKRGEESQEEKVDEGFLDKVLEYLEDLVSSSEDDEGN